MRASHDRGCESQQREVVLQFQFGKEDQEESSFAQAEGDIESRFHVQLVKGQVRIQRQCIGAAAGDHEDDDPVIFVQCPLGAGDDGDDPGTFGLALVFGL